MVQVNKVEVLKDCRKYLNLINLCNEGVFIRSFRIPDILITIPLLVPISYTTGLLYYYCFANHFDFNIIAFAFSVCIGSTQIALVYLTLTIEKRVIFDTMNEIQHLVDYRCHRSSASLRIYQKAAQGNADLANVLMKYVFIGGCVTFAPAFLVPVAYLLLGFPKPDDWAVPFPAKTFPYHNTFFGYYMTIGLQTLSGIDYLALFGVVVALEIGLCKFITTCAEDFKQQYNQLADTTYKDTMATKLILKDAIEIHQRMLSIMDHAQTILSGSFFFQMTVCATFIAIVLTSIDNNLQRISIEMVINIFCLLLELQLNFFSSVYATSVTTHANDIGEIVYNSEWYRLSNEQQRMVQFIIYRTEEPFYMKGYKIFTCSMETFQALLRTSFSYYLLLKQLKGN